LFVQVFEILKQNQLDCTEIKEAVVMENSLKFQSVMKKEDKLEVQWRR